MAIKLVVSRATQPNERRVALVPKIVAMLQGLGVEIFMQHDAGRMAGYPDASYSNVHWFSEAEEAGHLAQADIIFTLHMPNEQQIAAYSAGAILLGLLAPEQHSDAVEALQAAQVTSFAMEKLPRISRAQSMDVLSSQASAAGYQAVLLAAQISPRFFPMLTTAAGTMKPAMVLVIGAGVAGLQAIATAKRLGAIVHAYDVRSSVKEQIESLGAQMVDTGVSAEGSGGYARALTEQEQQQQQDVLASYVAKADVVITTAAIPGRAAPRIVSRAMVEAMQAGSVLVDLAAETGGNCELTQVGETIQQGEVTIVGPVNVPSQLAQHASDMYSRNLYQLTQLLINDGKLQLDWQDEILAATAITRANAEQAVTAEVVK